MNNGNSQSLSDRRVALHVESCFPLLSFEPHSIFFSLSLHMAWTPTWHSLSYRTIPYHPQMLPHVTQQQTEPRYPANMRSRQAANILHGLSKSPFGDHRSSGTPATREHFTYLPSKILLAPCAVQRVFLVAAHHEVVAIRR